MDPEGQGDLPVSSDPVLPLQIKSDTLKFQFHLATLVVGVQGISPETDHRASSTVLHGVVAGHLHYAVVYHVCR